MFKSFQTGKLRFYEFIKELLMGSNLIYRARRHFKVKAFKKKKEAFLAVESKGNGGSGVFSQVTYYAIGNAGDTMLSQCVRKTINHSAKNERWNIIPVNEEVTDATVDSINAGRLLVIGGGGLFLPDTNKNKISGWQWAISPEQLDQISCPICVYSVGYNYFRGQKSSELFESNLIKLLEKSSFFGLRNTGSIKAIKEIVPETLHDRIVFQPCTTTLIRKLYADTLPAKKTTGKVAFNIALDRPENRFGENKDLILGQIAQAAKAIADKGYEVYFAAHCGGDNAFIPYLKQAKAKFKAVDMSVYYPDKILSFYNQMDVVLGMRGHAQMIPFGLNCEIISLGSHDKMKWFLEDIDATDWYVELNSEPEKLKDTIVGKFETIHEKNREDTVKRLISQQDRLWDITLNNLKTISQNSDIEFESEERL